MPGVKLLILGDSILAGISWSNRNVAELLRSRRIGQNFAVHNAAVPGYTSAQALADWTNKYRDAGYTHLLEMVGTNDAAARIAATAIYSNRLQIIEDALSLNMQVVSGTLLPRSSGPNYGADLQIIVDELNTMIRALPSVDSRIRVVDFYQVMGEPDTPDRLRISDDVGDGLHPYIFTRMADAVDAIVDW